MVRHATPVVVAPALPCANRLEMLVARAQLHHRPFGLDPSDEPLLTVLLSFDPTDTDRRAARALATTFVAAEYSFAQAPAAVDLGTWAAKTLRELPASSACVVVALPDYSPKAGQQLGAIIDNISRSHHKVGLIAGVATAPCDWTGCDFDGFVVVEPSRRVADALRLFSALAAVMAPGLISCLDADDFLCSLGTAANPSRLAEAFYLVDSARLIPASRADSQVLGNAVGAAVMPSRCMPLKTLAPLVKRVRSRLRPNAAMTLVAPWGLTLEASGSASSVAVLLLCRPGAG